MNGQPPNEGTRRVLTTLAIMLAVILLLTGLATIGALVFVVVAMSNIGSNK